MIDALRKGTYGMCGQERIRTACAFAQSDQNLPFPHKHAIKHKDIKVTCQFGGYTGCSDYYPRSLFMTPVLRERMPCANLQSQFESSVSQLEQAS